MTFNVSLRSLCSNKLLMRNCMILLVLRLLPANQKYTGTQNGGSSIVDIMRLDSYLHFQ